MEVKWPTLEGRLSQPPASTIEALEQLSKSMPLSPEGKLRAGIGPCYRCGGALHKIEQSEPYTDIYYTCLKCDNTCDLEDYDY